MSTDHRVHHARSKKAAVARARFIPDPKNYPDGLPPPAIRYSLPRPAWWNLVAWLWTARRLFAMKMEDHQWKKSRAKSE